MKLVLLEDDGTKIAERPVREGTSMDDIICRNEYVAVRVIKNEDIAVNLEGAWLEPSEENIAALKKTGHLDTLNEPVEEDWDVISNAIYWADRKGLLKTIGGSYG